MVVGLVCIYLPAAGAVARRALHARSAARASGVTTFPLGRMRYPLAALAFVFALCSSVLPLLAVGSMAFMKYWAPYAFTPENFTLKQLPLHAVRLSAGLALGPAQPDPGRARRDRLRAARHRPGLVRHPHARPASPAWSNTRSCCRSAYPGIALGIGILSLWILVPGGIYGTLWILLLAYVTAHMPVAMQFVGSALHRIHTDLEDASRDRRPLGARHGPADRPAADAAGADRLLAADVRGDPARDLARDPALQPEHRRAVGRPDGRVVEADSIRSWRSIRCC